MKFYCLAKDFYVTKIFSKLRMKNGINKKVSDIWGRDKRKIQFMVIMIFISGFLFSFLRNRFDDQEVIYLNLFFLIIFFLIVLSSIFFVIRTGKEVKYFQKNLMNEPHTLGEKIMMYEITDKGIYFNEYNQLNKDEMTVIPWNRMDKIVVGTLSYPMLVSTWRSKIAHKNRLKRDIEAVQEIHKDFDFPVQLTQENNLGMTLYFNNVFYGYLPIPASMENTQTFIDEIGKYVPISYEESE